MTTAGLEVWDKNGLLVSSITDRFGVIIGEGKYAGSGSFPWPYPGVVGKRAVYCISNSTVTNNVWSFAYAKISDNGQTVTYDQSGDTSPITIIFYVY